MIYFLTKLLKAFIFLKLLNNYLKHEYPEHYNDYLMSLSFNAVYIISIIQIQANKIHKYMYKTHPRLKSYLDEYSISKNKNIDNVEFILDGKVIYLTDKEKIVNHIIHIVKEDFVIYSNYNSKNVCIDKKIIVKESNNLNSNCLDNDFIYEVSDIKFILCEVYVGDKVYKVTLKSDIEKYNYYLVDNIINKKFMIYYLIKFYNEDFSESTDKFILKLVDHNINSFEIDITDTSNYIQIKKDCYITNYTDQKKNETTSLLEDNVDIQVDYL